jgi:hypothetical protein
MTRIHRVMPFALATAVVLMARPVQAQTVIVTVPAGASFNVNDVSASTTGTPNPVTVSYSVPLLFLSNQKLKISVRADSATFGGPGTTHIAASAVSWTTTASTGTPTDGTLSSAAYGQVYRSPGNLNALSTGSANVHWTLAPIVAAGLRSGIHTLTVRWKFEAI